MSSRYTDFIDQKITNFLRQFIIMLGRDLLDVIFLFNLFQIYIRMPFLCSNLVGPIDQIADHIGQEGALG